MKSDTRFVLYWICPKHNTLYSGQYDFSALLQAGLRIFLICKSFLYMVSISNSSLTPFLLLGKHSAHRRAGCVCVKAERLHEVWEDNYGRLWQGVFEVGECILACLSPLACQTLFSVSIFSSTAWCAKFLINYMVISRVPGRLSLLWMCE
jgi:hypothetical protein